MQGCAPPELKVRTPEYTKHLGWYVEFESRVTHRDVVEIIRVRGAGHGRPPPAATRHNRFRFRGVHRSELAGPVVVDGVEADVVSQAREAGGRVVDRAVEDRKAKAAS